MSALALSSFVSWVLLVLVPLGVVLVVHELSLVRVRRDAVDRLRTSSRPYDQEADRLELVTDTEVDPEPWPSATAAEGSPS